MSRMRANEPIAWPPSTHPYCLHVSGLHRPWHSCIQARSVLHRRVCFLYQLKQPPAAGPPIPVTGPAQLERAPSCTASRWLTSDCSELALRHPANLVRNWPNCVAERSLQRMKATSRRCSDGRSRRWNSRHPSPSQLPFQSSPNSSPFHPPSCLSPCIRFN